MTGAKVAIAADVEAEAGQQDPPGAKPKSGTWKPGEVTMVVGITAFVLIICNGIVLGRPGDTVDIGLGFGYFVGLLASGAMLVAGYLRQAIYTEARKPPGVI